MTEYSEKTEQRIIQFLDKNGPSFMGEVVKGLKLSNSRGLSQINNLISKGVVRHSDPPLQFELNTETK
jgi:predicted ArsR family transcriptional regulator